MARMSVAVVGGGHGGHAMAALLSVAGHEVRLYDRYPEAVAAVAERGFVRYHGVAGEGEAQVDLVTTNLAAAVAGAGLVMVVLPAFAHAYVAEKIAPHLEPGQVVVLNTGSSGSALEFRAILSAAGEGSEVAVAETETLIYTCRLTGPGEVAVRRVKPRVAIAALPASGIDAVLGTVRPIYPQFHPAPNVLWTTLGNVNPVAHLPATLLNVALVERSGGDYLFWREGVTPSVGRMIEALDAERVRVAGAYGATVEPMSDWLGRVYGVSGGNVAERILANPAFAEVRGPADLGHRFVTEDVPMGLVPMVELGRIAGVETPAMELMIQLAGILNGEDYWASGRTLERMGLAGADRAAVLRHVG